MTSFKVNGGKHLRGEIIPQGAKNEALQVICATLLTPEKVTIHNIPDILDVNNLIDLIESLGAEGNTAISTFLQFWGPRISISITC